MKTSLILFCFLLFSLCYSQTTDVDLSKFQLCDLTINSLEKQYQDLKKVDISEMILCSNSDIVDARFENKIGYTTEFLPGVIFQKHSKESIKIAKIHLTEKFKGTLPNGLFVDMSSFNTENFIENNRNNFNWTTKDCSEYWTLSDGFTYFHIEIDKNKIPKHPMDEEFYKKQIIKGIDIIADCFDYNSKKEDINPLCIVDGKEVPFEDANKISRNDIETITILKDAAATAVYGKKGENGVIIIKLK